MSNGTYKVNLLRSLVSRELANKYKGTLFGAAWNVINPIFMLLIYSTVFLVVFKARWVVSDTETADYALMLFIGIVTHMFMSEVMSGAVNVIRSNQNIVKKVVFPLELFPLSVVMVAAFNFLIGLLLAFGYAGFSGYIVSYVSLLYVPLGFIVYLVTLCAIAYVLTVLSVFVKDMAQVIPVISLVMLFTSTVFFSVRSAPDAYGKFLYLNPISVIADFFRDLVMKPSPAFEPLLWLFLVSSFFLFLAVAFYNRVKFSFADVV